MRSSFTTGNEQVGRRGQRPPPVEVEVIDVERSDGFACVRFGGTSLAPISWPGPASHLKFFPPNAIREDGRPLSRTFTPRRYDAAQNEIEIDFLLHGEGPASSWARTAQSGERAHLSFPRATWQPPAGTEWLLLAGDDSAAPAIATLLEAWTSIEVQVVLETTLAADARLPLPSAAVRAVERGPAVPGAALETALAELEPPPGLGALWVACEASAVRRIRRFALQEWSLSQGALVTRGYWRLGESNHPDHDFGED